MSAAAKNRMSPVTEKFAKFAKFANFNPAPQHPTLLHRHAPHLGTISERAVSSPNLPLLSPTGEQGGEGL